MKSLNPNFRSVIEQIFSDSGFVHTLGLCLVDCGPGWCDTELSIRPMHLQQDGFFHAGVQATVGDHTAGAAAATLMPSERRVLTVEFKINLLRPGQGDALQCHGEVLKAGRNVSVSESSIYGVAGSTRVLISKATVTLALLESNELEGSRA